MPRKRKVQVVDGIKVYCKYGKLMPIVEIVKHPKNPNKHPPKQIEVLAHILRGNGWRLPLTVSARSGYLTRGEGRFLAAQHLGLTMVPVDIQDYDDEDAEISDLLADNAAPEGSVIDEDVLGGLVKTLDKNGCDLRSTGLDSDILSGLLEPLDTSAITTAPPLKDPPKERKPKQRIVITYRDPDELVDLNQYLGVDGSKDVYSAAELLGKLN